MLTTLKKLPTSIAYPENISILLVSPNPADLPALREILHHAHWELCQVETVTQAERHVNSNAPSVIVCERNLPDGSWKNLLRCGNTNSNSPVLLVASRGADEALWAEVLNLGGYDVLLKPFDKAEVVRVVGMAWRHSYQASRLATRPAMEQQIA